MLNIKKNKIRFYYIKINLLQKYHCLKSIIKKSDYSIKFNFNLPILEKYKYFQVHIYVYYALYTYIHPCPNQFPKNF